MTRLLVSVRSSAEARASVAGGADVIDVKEPARGPLGMADPGVWAEVRAVVPAAIPVSVALGEIGEWDDRPAPAATAWGGVAYRKLGLARSGHDALERWERLRREWGPGPGWVAVAYMDWERACSPPPGSIVEAACAADDCVGLLVDTWLKDGTNWLVGREWDEWAPLLKRSGRFVAVAGGLDWVAAERMAREGFDVVAVRGTACTAGDRNGMIDEGRVRRIADAVASGDRIRTGAGS